MTVVGAAGLRRGLGVEWLVPLRHVTGRIRFEDEAQRPIDLPNGSVHHRNETLVRPGDPSLLLHGAAGLGEWTVAARAGITIPLGRTEPNPFRLGREGLTHQHLQFGTGTWDPILGVGLGRRFGATQLSLTALGRLVVATNDHGYHAGHRLAVSAAADRRFGRSWGGQFGVDLAREESETWDGRREEEGNLGRTDLLVSLGVSRTLGTAGAVTLTVKLPVLTRATGAQLDYPMVVGLGWSR
jgi:hypothetical protein